MAKCAFTYGFLLTLSNHEGVLAEPIEQPVSSINKDVCDAKLLTTTVSTYAMDCIHFCHLMKMQHCCLCPNEMHHVPPAVHPASD